MFYPFDLVFETNKLVRRFESNGFKIITEIMNEFKNPKVRVLFAILLNDVNKRRKIADSFIDVLPLEEMRSNLNNMIENKLLDQLYSMMNVAMFEMGYNFAEKYDCLYWRKMFRFVKKLWAAIPDSKPVVGAKKGFKHIFDDFHDQVISKYPTLFVKQLKDVGSMYRCRSWSVNDDYELMIPNEVFAKDNRWNPDGVAYLYLACGDPIVPYDSNVNIVQKTCFEEIRLKDGNEVAVCQFIPIKKDAKIIDLCYEGVDLFKLMQEINEPPEGYMQTILSEIEDNPYLKQRIKDLAQRSTRDEFIKKANPELKSLLQNLDIHSKIVETVYMRTSTILLSLIDQSIFEAVDKIDDSELEAYLPFRSFSKYLIDKGYDGIIYRSTRMNKIGLSGKNIVLFDKTHATYEKGTMKKYKYLSGRYIEIS